MATDEIYADNVILLDLLGDNPRSRILACFLSEAVGEHYDLNVTRIATMAGVARKTVYDHLDPLLDLGVVEQTRKAGNSPMYAINRESDVAKKLAQLEWELLDLYAEREEADAEGQETATDGGRATTNNRRFSGGGERFTGDGTRFTGEGRRFTGGGRFNGRR